MAYEFKPYRSVYRDPQSVKVSEVLRNRYVDNFASDSMLDKQLNEMLVAAEFAGDVEKANELRTRLAQNATARTDRGDFENLGMSINMDVRDFSKNYQPLKLNYETREKDKETKRQLIGRPGGITQNQYDAWEKRSAMVTDETTGDYTGYGGIEYNEDGNLDRGSLYQPRSIASNINVDKEVLAALQSIEAELGGGYVRKKSTMKDYDGDGIPDAEYYIETESGKTRVIDPETVKRVTNQVLDRADVRSFMEQDADFATFELNEDELDGQLISRVKLLEGRLSSGRLTREESDAARKQIASLKNIVETGDVGTKRGAARQAYDSGKREGFLDMAVDSKAVNDVVGGARKETFVRLLEQQPPSNTSNLTTTGGATATGAGLTTDTRSPLAGDDGRVTEASAEEAIASANTDSETAVAALFQLYPGLASMYSGLDVNDPSTFNVALEMLDTSTSDKETIVANIEKAVEKNPNLLMSSTGGKVSPAALAEAVLAAKSQRETYLALQDSYEDIFNVARSQVSAGDQENNVPGLVTAPTDWGTLEVLNTDLGRLDVLAKGDEAQSKANMEYSALSVFQKLFDSPEEATVNHPNYGNIIDHLVAAYDGRLTRESIESVYDAYASGEDLGVYSTAVGTSRGTTQSVGNRVVHMPGADDVKFNTANALAGKIVNSLEAGHEATKERLTELGTGKVTYPIAPKPPYISDEKYKEFTDAVKAIPLVGPGGLLQRDDVTGENIATQLGFTADEGEIVGVSTTWYTSPSTGLPEPAFILKIKGKEGTTTKTGSVIVNPKVIAANAAGAVQGFGFNTLDNVITQRALAAYNAAPGVARDTGKIKTTWNDTGTTANYTFEFDANTVQLNTAEGTAESIDLTSGNVRVTGTHANGTLIDTVYTHAEWAKEMHNMGVAFGLEADVVFNNMNNATAPVAPAITPGNVFD